jgi:hypothetical protein
MSAMISTSYGSVQINNSTVTDEAPLDMSERTGRKQLLAFILQLQQEQ